MFLYYICVYVTLTLCDHEDNIMLSKIKRSSSVATQMCIVYSLSMACHYDYVVPNF